MTALCGDMEDAAWVCIRHLRIMNPAQFSFMSPSISYRKPERGRPRCQPSPSILVPRDHPEIEIQDEEFPPDAFPHSRR